MLRHSVSRSRSTPTSPRRGARRTHPRGGHLRALISRYSRPQGRNERHRRDHDAAGIAWRGLAPLVGVGNTQGRRPRRPTEGWAEVGAVFAPFGGACVYRLFIFGGRPKASSRRCKKEKVICQISSNSVWHFLRSAKKASLRPLRGGVSDGQGCRPGPANTGVPPATYGCSTAGGCTPRPP